MEWKPFFPMWDLVTLVKADLLKILISYEDSCDEDIRK